MGRGSIFVTGASSGIGRATAERLAKAGYDVIPGLRRPDTLPEPVKDPVTVDLADPDTIGPATQQVLDRAAGNLVAIVNNAGYSVSGPCESLSVDDWRAQFEVNLFGHIAITRALLPGLLANKGRILNIGSIGGRFASPFIAPYNASKFAVRGWTDSMRVELAPHGVHVVLIEPGSVDTAIWGKGRIQADEQLGKLTPEQRQRYGQQVAGAMKLVDYVATHGITPDKCAAVIEKAITTRRPKGRYVVGTDARVQAAASMLPVRVTDRFTQVMLRRMSKD
jgi:NAD(P)-dependent dehydrogenase (short-subunit alcohol dehydrogenase family)